MSEQNVNPVELFGMRVAHVGINAADPADALEIAELFSTMMGLPVTETPVSYFNDSLVEVMKQNGRGTKGHIGFAVNDIDAAEKWFAERVLPDGGTKLVYFKREFAGFAVHLCRE